MRTKILDLKAFAPYSAPRESNYFRSESRKNNQPALIPRGKKTFLAVLVMGENFLPLIYLATTSEVDLR